MTLKSLFLLLSIICFSFLANAQKIIYSSPAKDDTRRMNFEIAGKINGNFLIYKNIRNKNLISVLDNDMQEIASINQDYVPDNDRMINVDFFVYQDFCYMVYQYQRKNVVYCMASKIDGMGNKIGEVIEMDTTHLNFAANNKIYTVISSEDKSKLSVFKINNRNRKVFVMTTLLFDERLSLLKKSIIPIPMDERNDNLGDYHLDNDGNLVFAKFHTNSNENISKAHLVVKNAMEDSLMFRELNIGKIWLDEVHLKVDNYNKRYFFTAYYLGEKRGNIEGLYFFIMNKNDKSTVVEKTITFGEELRKEARGDASVRMAFNDYFIRDIITRKDGGFIIGSESYYTTSRFNSWNRWNYLYGSPFSNSLDNWYSSPYYRNSWWNNRSNSNQATRYHADNIAIMSFNSKGEPEWNTVIGKSQFDDESDDKVSYQLMNTGDQLHFLFNQMERRTMLLNDYGILPDGKLSRNPTLKNLERGYDFMPKYAKQVSSKQMIVPCLYRNYICFAKIDYN